MSGLTYARPVHLIRVDTVTEDFLICLTGFHRRLAEVCKRFAKACKSIA